MTLDLEDTIEENNKKRIVCWQCGKEVEGQTYKDINFIPQCTCGALYPEKPKLEAMLTIYQDDYLANRTQRNFDRLFNPLYDLVFNIICSKLKHSATRIPRENIEDMVQWTLLKLTTYYKTKPDFKITGSFTSYIGQVVLYPLYNKGDKLRAKKEISIYTKLNKNSESKERTILDELSDETEDFFEIKMLNRLSQDKVVENATNFIGRALNVLFSYHFKKDNPKAFTKVVELANMYRHYIDKKSERYYRELNRTCSPDLKENFDKSLEILKKYLENGVADE